MLNDFAEMRYNALGVARAVCRIELYEDNRFQSYGTGFLVAPNRVVTCYHVLDEIAGRTGPPLYQLLKEPTLEEPMLKAPTIRPPSLANVFFRFDFESIPGTPGVAPGETFRLAPTNWCSAHEPHWRCSVDHGAPGECPETPGRCQKQYLRDYLVLHLEGRPGAQRGWLERYPIQPATLNRLQEEPIWVVQHPRGSPMALSYGHILTLSLTAEEFLLVHNAATEDGSSGSPCLSFDWKVVAIHQGKMLPSEKVTAYGPDARTGVIMECLPPNCCDPRPASEPTSGKNLGSIPSPAPAVNPAMNLASSNISPQQPTASPLAELKDVSLKMISRMQQAQGILMPGTPAPRQDFRERYDLLIQDAQKVWHLKALHDFLQVALRDQQERILPQMPVTGPDKLLCRLRQCMLLLRDKRDELLETFPAEEARKRTNELWQQINTELDRVADKLTTLANLDDEARKAVALDKPDLVREIHVRREQAQVDSMTAATRVVDVLVQRLTAINGQINSDFFLLSFDLHGEAVLHMSPCLTATHAELAARLQIEADDVSRLKLALVALMQEHTFLQNLYDRCRPLQEQLESVQLLQDMEANWKSVSREINQLRKRLPYETRWLLDLERHSRKIGEEFRRLEEPDELDPAEMLDDVTAHAGEVCEIASDEFFRADRSLYDAVEQAMKLIRADDAVFRLLGW